MNAEKIYEEIIKREEELSKDYIRLGENLSFCQLREDKTMASLFEQKKRQLDVELKTIHALRDAYEAATNPETKCEI